MFLNAVYCIYVYFIYMHMFYICIYLYIMYIYVHILCIYYVYMYILYIYVSQNCILFVERDKFRIVKTYRICMLYRVLYREHYIER